MKPHRLSRASIAIAVVLISSAAALAQAQDSPSTQSSSSSSESAPPAAPEAPHFSTNPDPNAQVTVLENTLIRVMTTAPLSVRETKAGTPILFTLSQDVVVGHVLIIPRGAIVHGAVVSKQHAGKLRGHEQFVLELTSLDLAGRTYPLYTYQFIAQAADKKSPATKIVKGSFFSALAARIELHRVKPDPTESEEAEATAAGAAAGAGIGTLAAAATPAPALRLPPESQIDFYLASPISVVPVTRQEAVRLSRRLDPDQPILLIHGESQ